VAHFRSIEIGDLRQVTPSLKAHLLQQAQAGLIAFQNDRKEVPDPERRTGVQRVLDQGGAGNDIFPPRFRSIWQKNLLGTFPGWD
jgi:hypothetical protein